MSDEKTKQPNDFNELIKKWRLIQRPSENHDLLKKMFVKAHAKKPMHITFSLKFTP